MIPLDIVPKDNNDVDVVYGSDAIVLAVKNVLEDRLKTDRYAVTRLGHSMAITEPHIAHSTAAHDVEQINVYIRDYLPAQYRNMRAKLDNLNFNEEGVTIKVVLWWSANEQREIEVSSKWMC